MGRACMGGRGETKRQGEERVTRGEREGGVQVALKLGDATAGTVWLQHYY